MECSPLEEYCDVLWPPSPSGWRQVPCGISALAGQNTSRGKLGVASYEKVQGDGLVTSCNNCPHEVGQVIPVLVLASVVITVQVDLLLPQRIVLKVVVEIGYDGIGPLAATALALINEVVDLQGDALHAHSKDAHLPGDQKVQGARLHRERRKVHLLGIVKTEVHCKVGRTRRVWAKGRAASCIVSSLGILYHVLVEGALHEYQV